MNALQSAWEALSLLREPSGTFPTAVNQPRVLLSDWLLGLAGHLQRTAESIPTTQHYITDKHTHTHAAFDERTEGDCDGVEV